MKAVEIVLAVLLLLVTLNSTYFFLVVRHVKPIEWLVFNACAPANFAFLVGFIVYLIFKDRTLLHAALLPLFFFGGLGLFLFPWSGYNLIAQFSHVIMTLNIAVTLYTTFRTGDFKAATLGLFLGILIFAPFIGFQQNYTNSHKDAMGRILGVDPDNFQNKWNAGQ
ncbi:MAG TPA: hypothetical protein VHR47_13325 [Bacillota bacterium]|jgi:hypothetical protein|nr:hypothetical protein [Bacillota bacterium]